MRKSEKKTTITGSDD